MSRDLVKGKIGELSTDDLKEIDKKLMDLFKIAPEPNDVTASHSQEGDSTQQDSTQEKPVQEQSINEKPS